jgi:hypothetical protein
LAAPFIRGTFRRIVRVGFVESTREAFEQEIVERVWYRNGKRIVRSSDSFTQSSQGFNTMGDWRILVSTIVGAADDSELQEKSKTFMIFSNCAVRDESAQL